MQSKSKEERQLEKMIRKTGKEIHKLRKAKLGLGEPDKHMFREKMAFLTTSMCQVPPLVLSSDVIDTSSDALMSSNALMSSDTLMSNVSLVTSVSSRSSTLKHVEHPPSSETLLEAIGDVHLDPECPSSGSSTCSTPTPHLKTATSVKDAMEISAPSNAERFSYEIDPDIGVIV